MAIVELSYLAASIAYLFLQFSPGSNALSVIPAVNSLPNTVRAACRSRLATNITQCDDRFYLPVDRITASDLAEICTPTCNSALSTMYTAAISSCGNGSVMMPIDDLDPPNLVPLTPLHLAGAMVFRYNLACLRDKFHLEKSSQLLRLTL